MSKMTGTSLKHSAGDALGFTPRELGSRPGRGSSCMFHSADVEMPHAFGIGD